MGRRCRAAWQGGRARLHPAQWLLIEWPPGDAEPLEDFLSNLSADTAINDLVVTARMRWRIERDDQDLKQELGLGHDEGRGWRGFHHHAAPTIAAYGFLIAERLAAATPRGTQKTSSSAKCLRFPPITSCVAARRAQRHVPDSIATIRHLLAIRLVHSLGRCPHCGQRSGKLHL